jgi:hypothetical protein
MITDNQFQGVLEITFHVPDVLIECGQALSDGRAGRGWWRGWSIHTEASSSSLNRNMSNRWATTTGLGERG